MGYAISAFSARLLKHMKTLGATYNKEEYDSFMAVWRYSGHIMGIPQTILFQDADEVLKLWKIALMCEPDSPIESIVMAHALVNSAPLIARATEPEARRSLARYVYRLVPRTHRKRVLRIADVSAPLPLWSGMVVQDAAALRPHTEQAVAGPP